MRRLVPSNVAHVQKQRAGVVFVINAIAWRRFCNDCAAFLSQALIVWQWWNWLFENIPSGKHALRLNLDETSICLSPSPPPGIIAIPRRKARTITLDAPKRLRRLHMSFVAVIADDPHVQKLLPQFLIANEHTIKKSEFSDLRARMHGNVKLLRRKSAWTDAVVMVEILSELKVALTPFTESLQPLLLLDAAPQHVSRRVLVNAGRMGLWPCVVPPHTTFGLQPLDTHAFANFKLNLAKRYARERENRGGGSLDLRAFLAVVNDAIHSEITSPAWSQAFASNGFEKDQYGMSERVRDIFGIKAISPVRSRPSLDQLAHCFPKRARISNDMAYAPLLQRRPPLHRMQRMSSRPIPQQFGKTRSQTARLRTVARCFSDYRF